MNSSGENEGVWFVYDGECPVCTYAAQALRIKRKLGPLHLVDAREDPDSAVLRNITGRGYDLDEGMVILHQGNYYHGSDALKFMARHGAPDNLFNVLIKSLFWSKWISLLAYPWMRGTRNMMLARKKAGRIDNLGLKHEPIFKPIFGDAWDSLPPAIRKHYANRPYTTDRVTVEGTLDIMCRGPLRLCAPLLWLAGSVPPVNETNVPVTVHFDSTPDTKEFHFNRIFYFRNRKHYHFRSRMVQVRDNEVLEIMKFGICWRMKFTWEEGKVLMRHKGYALRLFGHFIPLPLTVLIGRGDAEETPVDDETFDMFTTITHPWFGEIYGYRGRFRVTHLP